MTMSDNNCLTNTIRPKHRFLFHWVTASATGVSAIIAFVCLYVHKTREASKHFQSAHSWLGLLTILLTLLSIGAGILLKVTLMTRVKKVVHSFLGIFTYSFAMITIMMGIHYTIYENHKIVAIGFMFILLILVFYVLMKPIALAVSRLKDLLR
jgi:Eukaryotic cytochrome b561